MFLLSGGIRRGVYMADVLLVWCWTVMVFVLAAGLTFLSSVPLYVFLSGFVYGEAPPAL